MLPARGWAGACLSLLLVCTLLRTAAADVQDISIGGVWVGRITRGAGGMSASDRAVEITRRLTEILSAPELVSTTVVITVRQVGQDAVVSVGRFLVVTIGPDDVAGTTATPLSEAAGWAARLAQGLAQAMPWTRFTVAGPAELPAAQAPSGNPSSSSTATQTGSAPAATDSTSAAPSAGASPPAGTPSTGGSAANGSSPTPPSAPSTPSGQQGPASSAGASSTNASSSKPPSTTSTPPAQQGSTGSPPGSTTGAPAPAPTVPAPPVGAPGSNGATSPPSAGVQISGLELVPTSPTHVAPGERVTFRLVFNARSLPAQPLFVTIAWQYHGPLTFGQYVQFHAVDGANTVDGVWFQSSRDVSSYSVFLVYGVVRVGDSVMRSSPVTVVVR